MNRVIAQVLRVMAATAAIVLCTLLPFLPGRYDPFAVAVSMLAQALGIFALLLVPIGALWMAFEYRRRSTRTRYVFAATAMIASAVVWVLVCIVALTESLSLALSAFGLGIYAVTRLLPRLSQVRSAAPVRGIAMPAYLVIVPIAVTLTHLALANRITELSRNRAIRNSAPLITDIEAYRTANGRYPPSVLSVWPDYKPSVIGIKEYRYEPSGDTYNLLFEQPSLRVGTREMVMYNPSDRQAIASHAMDVLQLTPEQLELDRRRGYNEVHDAGHPHWRYFWFD